MQVLEARGKPVRRGRRIALAAIGVVVLVAVVGGVAYTFGKKTAPTSPSKQSNSTSGTPSAKAARDVPPLAVTASTPAAGATNVASNAPITVKFSKPIALGATLPTLAPPVSGTWAQTTPTTLQYNLSAPLIPLTNEVLTVPSGTAGLRGRNGSALSQPMSIAFKVADGSTQRLQELLAGLNYMPVSFTPTGPAPAAQDMTNPKPVPSPGAGPTSPSTRPQRGRRAARTIITRAAVESFENQNGLTVDGLAGPAVWTTLLNDVAAQKVDPTPYVYVLVSKNLPENLTLYNNGAAQYSNIPVNTGASGGGHRRWDLSGLRARDVVEDDGHQPGRVHLRRPRCPLGQLLQRRRRPARLRRGPPTAHRRATVASR